MKLLLSYLRKHAILILMMISVFIIWGVTYYLYGLPLEAFGYGTLLVIVIGALFFLAGFFRYRRDHLRMQRLIANIQEAEFKLPKAGNAIEADYQELIKHLAYDRENIRKDLINQQKDYNDYYSLWVHQIKTPIAGMHLLMEEDNWDKEALKEELFRIEEYVGMVLSYIRLSNETSDYLFKQLELDSLVKSSIRKYSQTFILKKISCDFEPTGLKIYSDAKWAQLVIEQILANALKYSNKNTTIKIYLLQDELVIADEGIGIRPEDLPRLGQAGFTGYNGHEDSKSSGLGLYLCNQIMSKLNGNIRIESEISVGTKVYLKFPTQKHLFD